MEFEQLHVLPEYTVCSHKYFGFGIAVCIAENVLVISSSNLLHVFSLPQAHGGRQKYGFQLLRTLSGAAMSMHSAMKITFMDPDLGIMDKTPKLLVVDHKQRAVHVVDIAGDGVHLGYVVQQPVDFLVPNDVASTAWLAAVAFESALARESGYHPGRIRLYGNVSTEPTLSSWALLRVFGDVPDVSLNFGFRIELTEDATGLFVADWLSGKVFLFAVSDGAFVRRIADVAAKVYDIRRYWDGLLVLCSNDNAPIVYINSDGASIALCQNANLPRQVTSAFGLVLVPGMGCIVRDHWGSRIQVLTSGDLRMSPLRVAWFHAAYRGILVNTFTGY